MIELNKVKLRLSDKLILEDFDLQISRGDKAALQAPSGSGKTTILQLIMGFITPDSGEVLVEGLRVGVENIRTIRHKMSWLPQNLDIIGSGKVREALAYPMEFSLNKRLANGDPTEEYLELLGLDKSILDKSMDDISGGEKQRIGLALCKLMQRPILLLDEPSSALDKESKKKAMDFILRNDDTTVLSATHDKDWLNACNKIIEL